MVGQAHENIWEGPPTQTQWSRKTVWEDGTSKTRAKNGYADEGGGHWGGEAAVAGNQQEHTHCNNLKTKDEIIVFIPKSVWWQKEQEILEPISVGFENDYHYPNKFNEQIGRILHRNTRYHFGRWTSKKMYNRIRAHKRKDNSIYQRSHQKGMRRKQTKEITIPWPQGGPKGDRIKALNHMWKCLTQGLSNLSEQT